MRDINSEKHSQKKQEVILRKEYQPELIKVNGRFIAFASAAALILVFLLGFFIQPGNNLLQGYEAQQANADVYKVAMNPVLSAEIDVLKGQLIGLISGSIESKLRALELSVRAGKVTAADMGTIQDLKNDVQVLKTYSSTGAGRLIAGPYAEHKPVSHEMSNQLLNEVSQLKQLLYLSLASCGLMIAAIGGVWLRQGLRLKADNKTEALLADKAEKE